MRLERRHVLARLIEQRRNLDALIQELTTDDDRRWLADVLEAGESVSVRAPRYEGPEPAEVVAARYGVPID